MRFSNKLWTAALLLALPACVHRGRSLPASIPPVRGAEHVAFALKFIDMTVGTGAAMTPRQCVFAHYTGWLTDGKKFDSSHDVGENGEPRTPVRFAQGARQVIAGWDAGFEGMRVGGKRRLFIPYQLAYGALGRPPVIPPKAELIFDVELMALADTLPRSAPVAPATGPVPPSCPAWNDVKDAR